jgi:hypothetical protein
MDNEVGRAAVLMSKEQSPTEAYRADRLRRAWLLIKAGGVERRGGTRYRVAGNDESSYDVDLSVDPPCYCADM